MTLVDANIPVYAAGVNGDRERQEVALGALEAIHGHGALAVQVLAEYSHVMLRHRVPIAVVLRDVAALQAAWTIHSPTRETVSLALEGIAEHHMSFWDATLWAVAKENGLDDILSEDGPTGTTVGSVLFPSPL